jgi:Ca-activated chloride channel homolog
MQQYKEAVRLKPEDPYFYKQLVERAVALGRNEIARETLAEMSKRFSNQRDVWGPDEILLLDLLKKQAEPANAGDKDLQRQIRRHLIKDLVVVMSWDTDRTDIDLHVKEPGGEECFYSHRNTAMGGVLDHDDTDGFGPETYALRRGKPGAYKIEAEYYGGTPRTVVTIQIFRHRNGEDESVVTKTIELRKTKERVTVETIQLP